MEPKTEYLELSILVIKAFLTILKMLWCSFLSQILLLHCIFSMEPLRLASSMRNMENKAPRERQGKQ